MFCTDGWHYVTEAYWAFCLAADDEPDVAAEEKPHPTAEDKPDLAADDEPDFAFDDEPDLSEDQGSARKETGKQRRARQLKEEQLTSAQIYKALRCLRQVGILLPSGVIAKGSMSFVLGAPRLKGSKTRTVDLTVGTVGTGTFRDMYEDEDPALQRLELEREYGIFLGCPVMAKAEEIDEAIKLIFPWQTTGFDLSLEQQTRVDDAINELTEPPRRPGPRGWYNGLLQRMVRKEFELRIGRGDYVGKMKKEAYLEAYKWLKKLTDEDVPIDTVEGWVRPIFQAKEVGINPNSKDRNVNPADSGN